MLQNALGSRQVSRRSLGMSKNVVERKIQPGPGRSPLVCGMVQQIPSPFLWQHHKANALKLTLATNLQRHHHISSHGFRHDHCQLFTAPHLQLVCTHRAWTQLRTVSSHPAHSRQDRRQVKTATSGLSPFVSVQCQLSSTYTPPSEPRSELTTTTYPSSDRASVVSPQSHNSGSTNRGKC
jgi:hypothetical protein